MPRPTVRRWCEHGYNTAYQKTLADLATHFNNDNAASAAARDNSNIGSKQTTTTQEQPQEVRPKPIHLQLSESH